MGFFEISMLALLLFIVACALGVGYLLGAESGYQKGLQEGVKMADEQRLFRLTRKKT